MLANDKDFDIRWEPLVDVTCDFCPNTVEITETEYSVCLHEGEMIRCSDCGGEQPRQFEEKTYSVKGSGDGAYMAFWDDVTPECRIARGCEPIDNAQERR